MSEPNSRTLSTSRYDDRQQCCHLLTIEQESLEGENQVLRDELAKKSSEDRRDPRVQELQSELDETRDELLRYRCIVQRTAILGVVIGLNGAMTSFSSS